MVDLGIKEPISKEVFKIIVSVENASIIANDIRIDINTTKVFNELLGTLKEVTTACNNNVVNELFIKCYKDKNIVLMYIDYLYTIYNRNKILSKDKNEILRDKIRFTKDIPSMIFLQD